MAHSIVTFKDRAYIARDEVISFIVKQLGTYAEQRNIQWLSQASKEWAEHCDVMPPSCKRIELDRWITGDHERREIVAAIDCLAGEYNDTKLEPLMRLDDLKACIQP